MKWVADARFYCVKRKNIDREDTQFPGVRKIISSCRKKLNE